MKKILFVCTGNICRSVIAEHLFNKIIKNKNIEGVEASSAGIEGNPEYKIYGYLAKLMTAKGIDYSRHKSRKITTINPADYDLIIVMEQFHKNYISRAYPGSKEKVKLLTELAGEGKIDIPDPLNRPDEVYDKVFEDINRCVAKIQEVGSRV